MKNNNIQIGNNIFYQKNPNKNSWQDNLMLYIFVSLLIIVIGDLILKYFNVLH